MNDYHPARYLFIWDKALIRNTDYRPSVAIRSCSYCACGYSSGLQLPVCCSFNLRNIETLRSRAARLPVGDKLLELLIGGLLLIAKPYLRRSVCR